MIGGVIIRVLLKAKERRQLEIIEFLLETTDWITITELSTKFNCSTRVIKADIAELRVSHPELEFEASYLGIKLIKDSMIGVQEIYKRVINNTLAYQLLEEIFFDETLTVEQLADILFVSPSTIYRTITQINEYFKANYDCYVEANPCRFIGNEQNIRLYYRTFFSEKYTIFEWPFRGTDEEEINSIFDKVLTLVSDDMPLDFAYYEDIKLVVMVNRIRYRHNHLLEKPEGESDTLNLILKVFSSVIVPLGFKVPGSISKEAFYQVFGPYVKKDVPRTFRQLAKVRKRSDARGKALSFLHESLVKCAEQWKVSIDINYVTLGVINMAVNAKDIINSDFLLFDRNKYFVMTFAKHFPDFYEAIHSIIVTFLEMLDIEPEEITINYILFTLIFYWYNLIPEYIERQLTVPIIILSDKHYFHSKFLKNILELQLPQTISIEIITQRSFNLNDVKQSEHEIIISTFPLVPIDNKEVIIIHDYPTEQDVANIKEAIHKKQEYLSDLRNISKLIL